MIALRDVVAGLTGAWRLARFDPRGMSYLDTTITGYWRSFYGALLCLPAYVVMVAVDVQRTPVLASVERLLDRGLVELLTSSDGQELCFAATPAARARLPDLLEALPLSRSAPDIGYKLKMMSLDLLDGTARERQLAGLVEHWRDLLALWKEAEAHCPCVQPMVRHWMRRNALLARSEIEWLTSVGDVRAASRAAV